MAHQLVPEELTVASSTKFLVPWLGSCCDHDVVASASKYVSTLGTRSYSLYGHAECMDKKKESVRRVFDSHI